MPPFAEMVVNYLPQLHGASRHFDGTLSVPMPEHFQEDGSRPLGISHSGISIKLFDRSNTFQQATLMPDGATGDVLLHATSGSWAGSDRLGEAMSSDESNGYPLEVLL